MCRPLQLCLPRLPHSPLLDPLIDLCHKVLLVTLAYEQYQRSNPQATSLHNILMARHSVLHDLLVLGDYKSATATVPKVCSIAAAKLQSQSTTIPNEATIYNLTYLSTMSYLALDLYPWHDRGPGPHSEIAKRLSKAIKDAIQIKLMQGAEGRRYTVLFEWANELLARLIVPLAE
jgi:hypothetical protein